MDAPSESTSIGSFLRREREVRQLSLEELAQTTRIPLRQLRLLEQDRFDELPGEVFARGFIKSYARALGVDDRPLLERFDRGRSEADAPAPITAITPPERGRRFGIAIALVVLLILFTLALSIVLRPRHRDTPVELSYHTPSACLAGPSSPMLSCSAASTTATPTASSPS
ncbi:MAG: helix-turn-helix domain-containing protein [Myxococcota bacterium]